MELSLHRPGRRARRASTDAARDRSRLDEALAPYFDPTWVEGFAVRAESDLDDDVDSDDVDSEDVDSDDDDADVA